MKTSVELAQQWLVKEGYKCEIDKDGDLYFKYQGSHLYVYLDEKDPHYLHLVMHGIWKVDSDREEVMEVLNTLCAEIKTLKGFILNDKVLLSIEMFFDPTSGIDCFFERCCDILVSGRNEFFAGMKKK